jgi:hypothetical protein
MVQSQARVVQNHSGTGETHYFLCLFPHVWAITMDWALAARAFLFLKRALVKAHESIIEKLYAFGAELAFGLVFLPTIISNHGINGFFLPLDSWMLHVRL